MEQRLQVLPSGQLGPLSVHHSGQEPGAAGGLGGGRRAVRRRPNAAGGEAERRSQDGCSHLVSQHLCWDKTSRLDHRRKTEKLENAVILPNSR